MGFFSPEGERARARATHEKNQACRDMLRLREEYKQKVVKHLLPLIEERIRNAHSNGDLRVEVKHRQEDVERAIGRPSVEANMPTDGLDDVEKKIIQALRENGMDKRIRPVNYPSFLVNFIVDL